MSGSAAAGQVLTCTIGNLGPSASQSLVLPLTATLPGDLTIQAFAGVPLDSNPANNGPVPVTVTVIQTCGQYNTDKSRFDCGTAAFNSSASSSTSPSSTTCCAAVAPPPATPDVSASISLPASLPVGTPFDVTLGVKVEDGQGGAQGVTLLYTIPDGLQLAGTLNAGRQCCIAACSAIQPCINDVSETVIVCSVDLGTNGCIANCNTLLGGGRINSSCRPDGSQLQLSRQCRSC